MPGCPGISKRSESNLKKELKPTDIQIVIQEAFQNYAFCDHSLSTFLSRNDFTKYSSSTFDRLRCSCLVAAVGLAAVGRLGVGLFECVCWRGNGFWVLLFAPECFFAQVCLAGGWGRALWLV